MRFPNRLFVLAPIVLAMGATVARASVVSPEVFIVGSDLTQDRAISSFFRDGTFDESFTDAAVVYGSIVTNDVDVFVSDPTNNQIRSFSR